MAGLTLEMAEQQLKIWLEADVAVAQNQQWSHGGQTYTRADAQQIRANIEYWDGMCKRLSGPAIRISGVIPA